jgi:hypothetical protein
MAVVVSEKWKTGEVKEHSLRKFLFFQERKRDEVVTSKFFAFRVKTN